MPAESRRCLGCGRRQPIEAVLQQSFDTMAAVLRESVGVEFVTKGAIPDRFLDLFSRHRGRVSCQVGLTMLDEGLRRLLEPGAATVAERLRGISRLRDVGVSVEVRADPLIHGVTDSDSSLGALVPASRERGVTAVAASYLFLRPAIAASLKRHVADRALVERILAPYAERERFRLRGGAGGGLALPRPVRRRLRGTPRRTRGSCGVPRLPPKAERDRERSERFPKRVTSGEPRLFPRNPWSSWLAENPVGESRRGFRVPASNYGPSLASRPRPCRYTITRDGYVVLASETGVLEFPGSRILRRGRPQPGRMFLVDLEENRVVPDNEIKAKISRQKPYRRWVKDNRIELRGLFTPPQAAKT